MLGTRSGFRVAAGFAVLALAATACGSKGGGGSASQGRIKGDPNTINSVANPKKGGTFTYALEKTIDNWNILTSAGNTFETAEVMDAIYPSTFIAQPDLSVKMNDDLLLSAEVTNQNPETIVYKINPKAVWSDGVPINADDFKYVWQASANCKDCDVASSVGYTSIQSIEGSGPNNQTVTVTFKQPFSDWKSLFGPLLPAHAATPKPTDEQTLADSWNHGFADNPPKISGGPYVISSYQKDQSITLVPNPKWYGKKGPYLDKLVFRMITDATQEPPAFQNHEIDAMYPQPEVDLIKTLNGMQNVVYQEDLGLVYEHFDFNLENKALTLPVRQALFTAVNRQQILDATVKQFDPDVTVLNNRMFVPGQKGYQDNVTKYGLGTGDIAKAKDILTKAGYKIENGKLIQPDGTPFPALTMQYTVGNQIRQTECQLFAQAAAQLGVTVNVQSTDSLGKTLTNADAQHHFDVVVFAWVATPFPASGNAPLYESNKAQGGDWGGNYGHWVNSQADQLLQDATSNLNPDQVIKDLNQADQLISQDAYTLPLYQKPTLLAYYNTWGNIRDNATSVGPPYNVQEWGLKPSAA
ncbi:MAG: ABC transporter family substrate-binding protein [Acidothermus cellulolyticus]|nr:ABC transporter family substrate-binding protein [Acidothermus cellulolyticus]